MLGEDFGEAFGRLGEDSGAQDGPKKQEERRKKQQKRCKKREGRTNTKEARRKKEEERRKNQHEREKSKKRYIHKLPINRSWRPHILLYIIYSI